MEQMQQVPNYLKVIVGAMTAFVVGNLLFLDFVLLQQQKRVDGGQPTVREKLPIPQDESTQNLSLQPADTNFCPNACVAQIYQATTSASAKQETIADDAKTDSSTGVKDYYIPFGTGTNATDSWADVAGAQATIDSAQYGAIQSVLFDVAVTFPTTQQDVYVRLYNVSDKVVVNGSEVLISGGNGGKLFSQPITLAGGSKTYQVQMKTQLKATTNLTQARLHITTN